MPEAFVLGPGATIAKKKRNREFDVSLRDFLSHCVATVANSRRSLKYRMPDIDVQTRDIYHRISKYTMTSPERIAGLCQAVRYVTDAKIPGAYVECGVWRGGSSMAAALSFIAAGDTERLIYLFDTFEGMTAPSIHDRRAGDGTAAAELLKSSKQSDKIWCNASIEDVTANMMSTSYDMERIILCKGMVEKTIPEQAPEQIAVLRLDTDWYESTKHELEHLYPRLSAGGVLIIDDYGYWAGARKAVDEYFSSNPILLNRLDKTGRIAVK